MKIYKRCSKGGFTLTELMIVIAVLAILAAVAIPVVSNIINAAVLSTANQNAGTLDMFLKEAQTHISVKDTSVYGAPVSSRTLTIGDVVQTQHLEKACETYTYKGRNIACVWNVPSDGVRLMYLDDNTDVESGVLLINYQIIDETNATLIVGL